MSRLPPRSSDPTNTGSSPLRHSKARPADVWALLWNWESLLAVGLPGLTSDFTWLSGGPDQVPSTFQFVMATSILKEEIYERTAEEGAGRYRLRSRVLEPALDVLEYDAVLELQRIPGAHTAYSAAREVRLAWCGAGHASRNGRVRDPVSQGILRD
jgi:hypothetical protein